MRTLWHRRVLAAAAALSLAAVAGGVFLAGGTAHAQVATTGTVTFRCDTGETMCRGKTSYSTSKGDTVSISSLERSDAGNNSTVAIGVRPSGMESGWDWDITIDAPGKPGQPIAGRPEALVPGTYTEAHRWPFNGMGPGLDVNGFGQGCNELTGSFTITKAVFGPGGYVQAFNATFVQHCEGAAPALRGEIRISNPPAPPASPSPSQTTTSPYAPPTSSATGLGPAVAGAAATPSPSAATYDASRAMIMTIGFGAIALLVIALGALAAFGIGMAVRGRRLRQATVSPEPLPAGVSALSGVVMNPWSLDDSAAHRLHPNPPVARWSVPGKVIAVSIVLGVRGTLGLLLSVALLEAAHLRTVHGLPVASWYTDVIWFTIGVCAGEIVSGAFLWRGRSWPLVLGRAVLWVDIVAGVFIMLATSLSCGGLFGIAVDAVILAMLSWSAVKEHCF
jgi:hypothetical protein